MDEDGRGAARARSRRQARGAGRPRRRLRRRRCATCSPRRCCSSRSASRRGSISSSRRRRGRCSRCWRSRARSSISSPPARASSSRIGASSRARSTRRRPAALSLRTADPEPRVAGRAVASSWPRPRRWPTRSPPASVGDPRSFKRPVRVTVPRALPTDDVLILRDKKGEQVSGEEAAGAARGDAVEGAADARRARRRAEGGTGARRSAHGREPGAGRAAAPAADARRRPRARQPAGSRSCCRRSTRSRRGRERATDLSTRARGRGAVRPEHRRRPRWRARASPRSSSTPEALGSIKGAEEPGAPRPRAVGRHASRPTSAKQARRAGVARDGRSAAGPTRAPCAQAAQREQTSAERGPKRASEIRQDAGSLSPPRRDSRGNRTRGAQGAARHRGERLQHLDRVDQIAEADRLLARSACRAR